MPSDKLQPNFLPPPIDPDSDRPLAESVIPSGWENLGGGLSWYEVTADAPQDHPEHGKVLPIRYTGTVGQIVRGLVESARSSGGRPKPKAKAYLLHGAPGIGKTLFLQLMAETFITKEHEPISFGSGDSKVTFVDQSGRTLPINPVLERPSRVERARQKENLDDPNVKPYNAGASDFNKQKVDEMVTELKRAPFPGQRRVFLIQEVDGIRYDQSQGLKSGLDPQAGIPDNVLVLADTNHIEKVKSNLQGGFQRFQQRVAVKDWSDEELAGLAKHYCKRLSIEFDEGTFEGPLEPYWRLGNQAEGAVRELLFTLDLMRGSEEKLTLDELQEILTRDRVVFSDPPRAVTRFFELPNYNADTVGEFCRRQGHRNTSFYSFANGMVQYLATYNTDALCDPDITQALAGLAPLMNLPQDAVSTFVWSSSVGPLSFIGARQREHFHGQYQQQQ